MVVSSVGGVTVSSIREESAWARARQQVRGLVAEGEERAKRYALRWTTVAERANLLRLLYSSLFPLSTVMHLVSEYQHRYQLPAIFLRGLRKLLSI